MTCMPKIILLACHVKAKQVITNSTATSYIQEIGYRKIQFDGGGAASRASNKSTLNLAVFLRLLARPFTALRNFLPYICHKGQPACTYACMHA